MEDICQDRIDHENRPRAVRLPVRYGLTRNPILHFGFQMVEQLCAAAFRFNNRENVNRLLENTLCTLCELINQMRREGMRCQIPVDFRNNASSFQQRTRRIVAFLFRDRTNVEQNFDLFIVEEIAILFMNEARQELEDREINENI